MRLVHLRAADFDRLRRSWLRTDQSAIGECRIVVFDRSKIRVASLLTGLQFAHARRRLLHNALRLGVELAAPDA